MTARSHARIRRNVEGEMWLHRRAADPYGKGADPDRRAVGRIALLLQFTAPAANTTPGREELEPAPMLEAVIARAIDSFPTPLRPRVPPPPKRRPDTTNTPWKVTVLRWNGCGHVLVAPPGERVRWTKNECLNCGRDELLGRGVCLDCQQEHRVFAEVVA